MGESKAGRRAVIEDVDGAVILSEDSNQWERRFAKPDLEIPRAASYAATALVQGKFLSVVYDPYIQRG
jgi:hypothetical protein